jgi:hypothetical protein
LIAGHSHRFAYDDYFRRSGLTARIAILDQPHPVALLNGPTSTIASDPYWALALSSARERALPLAILWDGNQHNHHFLLESDQRFSVFPANGPWEDGDRRPLIPRSLFQEFFSVGLGGLRAVLEKSAGLRVLLLGTPPPKSDDEVREGIKHERPLVEWAARHGMTPSTVRITPLLVRLELWRITQDLVRAVAHEFGATFVGAPDRGSTNGALAAEESIADATHANGLWAEVMVEEAQRVLARP